MARPYQKKTKTTITSLAHLCGPFLQKINRTCGQRGDLVLMGWKDIIGEHLEPMAKAKRFKEGILEVEVSNSSLLSILSYQEKRILLKKVREKFPKTDIKDIRFRLG